MGDVGENDMSSGFVGKLDGVLSEIRTMLIEKNKSYGNSALDPLQVFSRLSAEERMRVRIDDKLSRLARGHEFGDEDTIKDLIGYLLLMRIAKNETE